MAAQFSVEDGLRWKMPFFTIWSGQALSLLGSQLVQFALIWYLTVETGSATVLATASMMGMLPSVVLGPFIGTLVDRWNRQKVMILADSVIMLATVILAILFALEVVVLWHIFVVLFFRSFAGGFHRYAMSASTSLMVPVEHLTRIQGLNQMLNGGLNVVSAPLGAMLIELLPLQGILAIDVFTALVAVGPLFFLKVPQPESIEQKSRQKQNPASVWQEFRTGLKYMLGWPGLLFVGFMAIFLNFLLTPSFSLLPLLVKEYFQGDVLQLGWVNASFGIGVILGGLILGAWGGFKRKIATTFMGLMGIGVGALVMSFAPSTSILWPIGASLLMGLMIPITNGPIHAVIQASVAPDMQARVFSLLSSLAGGMAPIGLMIAGPVSDWLRIQTWFMIAGIVCFLMAVTGFLTPAAMNIEENRKALKHASVNS